MSGTKLVEKLLQTLWTESNTKDLEIICNDGYGKHQFEVIKCHRPILAISCRLLRSILREGESCLYLTDFSSITVTKFLKKCYLVEGFDEEPESQEFCDLIETLGVTTVPFESLTPCEPIEVPVNPSDLRTDTSAEVKLQKLITINSGLTVVRGSEDVSHDESPADELQPDADSFTPISNSRYASRLNHLMSSSKGKLVVVRTPGKRKLDTSDETHSEGDGEGEEDDRDDDDNDGSDDDVEKENTSGTRSHHRSFAKPETPRVNLRAIHNKGDVNVRVKCWECSEIVATNLQEYEEIIMMIQKSIPNYTANYRCQDCLNTKGLPTEEEMEAKKQAWKKKKLEEKRKRQKKYNRSALPPEESVWKNENKMEEFKSHKLLCQFCGKQFSMVQGHLYWEHMNMHQKISPYKCYVEGCDFEGRSNSELNWHNKRVHPPEGTFQCDKCPVQFQSLKILEKHCQKYHVTSDENIFECDQCFYRSSSQQALTNHKSRWHKSDDQKLSCKLCDARMNNRKSIYDHMRKVHNVERKCKFCDFAHQDSETVRRHIYNCHRDQMPFACNLCLFCTNQHKLLKRHLELRHPNIFEKHTQEVEPEPAYHNY